MKDDRPPTERVDDVEAIGRAMRQAVREALWQHKLAGNPVPVWQDGGVVWIPASELDIPEDDEIEPTRVRPTTMPSRRGVQMTIAVDAVWEDGVLRPERPLNLPERARVHVIIESEPPARTQLGARLREIRQRIVRDPKARLLSPEEVEEEIAVRRGGWQGDR